MQEEKELFREYDRLEALTISIRQESSENKPN